MDLDTCHDHDNHVLPVLLLFKILVEALHNLVQVVHRPMHYGNLAQADNHSVSHDFDVQLLQILEHFEQAMHQVENLVEAQHHSVHHFAQVQ